MTISRPVVDNVFVAGDNVAFTVVLKDFYAGSGTLQIVVTDYFDQTIFSSTTPVSRGSLGNISVPLALGTTLPPGHYKIASAATYTRTTGEVDTPALDSYFGIAGAFSTRTATQVRTGGYRFGLKTFSITGSQPPYPTWNLADAVNASAKLGLQWTRHLFNAQNTDNDVGTLSTSSLVSNYPMNVALKVEGFPDYCFDVGRYGSLASWQTAHPGKRFDFSTVPVSSAYQTWFLSQLDAISIDQNVFELANEPWNQIITPEEFAEYCQISGPILKTMRSSSVVGPNLGVIDWDKRFIAAGGMAGLDMVTLHPYSWTPLPETRTRAFIRNYRDFLYDRLGRNPDLYTTEYGWSNAPVVTSAAVVDEKLQAQRTVRESLMLYAEGLKTLIPHANGDREDDPNNWDVWFGFFHRNGEPRPVLMAHANCARMIDGGNFVGDLNLGPGVGAMLFERGGVYTLALWTAETARNMTVNTGVSSLTKVDIVGKSTAVTTTGGNLSLALSGNVVYLVGVSSSLAAQAVPPGRDLDPDTWSSRVGSVAIAQTGTAPTIDGVLSDWAGATPLPLTSGTTTIGNAYMKWDASYLYVAASITDAQILASSSTNSLTAGDALALRLATRPSRQLDLGGWDIYEYDVYLAPTSSAGTPAFRMECSNWTNPLVNPPANDPSGLRWASTRNGSGWTAEMKIPLSLLDGFPPAVMGSKLAFFLEALDKDSAGGSVTEYPYLSAPATRTWPYLVLGNSSGVAEVIVDNADPAGVVFTGSWTVSTNSAGYYGINYVHDGATLKGTKSVCFSPDVPLSGVYQVYTRWISGSNRATNVPITIVSASGTTTVPVNEQINGSQWVSVGTYNFASGTAGSLTVSNSGTAGTYVIADAVRLVQTGTLAEVIMDNHSPGVVLTGTWVTGTNSAGYYGTDYIHDGATQKGTKNVRFVPTIASAGPYEVYAYWTADTNRAADVPMMISSASGTATVQVNEQLNGRQWNSLGVYTFNTGTTGSVTISNSGTAASKYVIVDAVKFVPR